MFRKSLAALALGLLATGVATAGDIKDDPDFKALQKDVKDVKGLQSDLRELVGLLKSQAATSASDDTTIAPAGFSTSSALLPALIGNPPPPPRTSAQAHDHHHPHPPRSEVNDYLQRRLEMLREEERVGGFTSQAQLQRIDRTRRD